LASVFLSALRALGCLLLGLVLVAGARPAAAQAPSQIIHGPVSVKLPSASLFTFSNSFSAPPSVTGPFLLRVQLSARNSLTSLSFNLNNVQVLSLSDFAGGITQVDRTVTVLTNNTYSLQVAGKAGTVITITVFATPNLPKPTSLAPNPLSVTLGASGTLTAALSPTPTAAGTLSVTSSNTAVATAPASVSFTSGQTSVAIAVTTHAVGSAIVTASANGGQASATVNVTPAPPTVTSLTPQSLAVTQGASGNLTVTISAAQTADTHVLLASSNANIASVAYAVTVLAGQVSALIPVAGVSPGTAQITASLSGSSASSQVSVSPAAPSVVSLVPATSTVTLGASTTLTLTISAARSTDTNVPLTVSPPGIVSIPASVTVLAGQTTAPVAVGTLALGQAGITASLNSTTASAAVNVVAPPVAGTSLQPASFTLNVGATSSSTGTINATQSTATPIALAVDNPSVLQIPASVTVAQGSTSAVFTATGLAVGNAIITASANGTSKTSSVHVSPQAAAIVSLLPNPLPLQQGATGSLTVTINVAQGTDTVIALADDAPAIAQVAASVTVPAGAISAPIPVSALATGTANVTASVNGTSAVTAVQVSPPPPVVTGITPAKLTLPKGTPGTLRVTVSRAPNTATAVTLSSSDPSVASVPPSVNIPAGALFAEFPVASNAVGQATISASLNGGSATATVTITPAELVALTLSPQTPTNYVGEAVPFTATGTMTDGTSEDFTTRLTWSSSNTSVATIASTGVASALSQGHTTVTASFTFTAAQSGQPVTISSSTVLTVKTPTALVLAAPMTSLRIGQSVTVTVSTSDAPAFGGLLVTLSGGGSGAGTYPPAVTIPEYQTSVAFQFTATAAGNYTIGAAAANRLPALLSFSIAPQIAISSVTPASAQIGAVVTLAGTGFDPVAANNQIAFRSANDTTVASAALSASATQITVRVPPLAESGPIAVTNANGTAQSPVFTVLRDQDFQLVVSPATVTVYQSASNSAQVQLSSTGLKPFTGLVTLSAQGLPSGITASFSPAPTLSGAQAVTATFAASAGAGPGTYAITLRGDHVESGAVLMRSATLNLAVQSAASVTGMKGRFVTPTGMGIGGVIVRADTAQSPQPQTTTDAAGNFLLVGLPAGQITFRFDATPANPLYPIWPYTATLPANAVTVLPEWTINPPPSDEKFVPIANATQEQVITDQRFPGLEIRLPAGTVITGWDGVPKTRIAVEKVQLGKLTVTAPPVPTGSMYQLFFGTPMGGVPSSPIPVTLPNDVGAEPGDSINVWFFDGSPMGGSGEWKIAGQGIVSADGKTIRMPNGTGIPRFCGVCGLMCPERPTTSAAQTDVGPTTDCQRDKAANPITLATGQETPANSGLTCSGLTPISTGMTYNPIDAFNNIGGTAGSLGFGWVLDYDVAFLPFAGPQKRLILPGNNRVNFTDDGSGVYRPVADPRFDGAEIRATNPATNEWELTFRDRRVWRFQPFSNVPTFLRGGPPTFVTEMVDPQGNVLSIRRQATGRITAIGDGERGVIMSYGSNGFVSGIVDTAGRAVSYTYTPTNRLSTLTDADGRVTSYTYVDENEVPAPAAVCGPQPSFGERIKTITYPGRPTPTENFYGPGRRVLRQTGYDGREFRFAYKLAGACVTNISDPNTRCTGASCPDVDSWDNFQAGWRVQGGTIVATTVTQPNGATRTVEFNSQRVTTARVDAQGQRETIKLDAGNRVTERADALGQTSKYQYDAKGNVTRITDPLGRFIDMTYDSVWNKPTSVTRYDDANQPQAWSFTYDATKGTLLTATNPLNQATTFAYTPRGELQAITDALDHATRFEYDLAGDVVKVIDALLNETSSGTDGAGRRVSTVDALGNATSTAYNGIDRVTRVTDAKNQQTNLSYDPAGRLASVTNARSFAIESYGYDTGDRLATRTDAKLKQTLYSYDSFGRLERMTDRKGLATTYAYDEQDRVISVTRPEGSTRFSYDAVGRLAEISDPSGTISYGYDAAGRVVRETQATGGATSIIEYGYDALDRRTSRTVAGVFNEVTTYGYDRANRLTGIGYRGQTSTLEYDAAGRLTVKVLPNAIRQELAYDDADRLLSITYKNPDGSLIESLAYGYDAAGRRVLQTTSGSALADSTFTASYDEADRMTAITLSATAQTFVLAYDDNGNLLEKRESANPSNLTTYGWDSRNRLSAIAAPGLAASFEYDALNRRIGRTVNGVTTRYVYDGLQALGEIVNGEPIGLLTGLNLDEAIARYTSQGARVLLTDALNSVLAQTKDDRSVQNYYAYSPYGEASALGVDEGNSIQYTARENDQTGIYFYRARYYDPVLKRFISEDPIGLMGGANVYGYVGGNPVSFIDPSGNFIPAVLLGAGAIGAVIGGLSAAAQTYNSGGTGVWNYVSAIATGAAVGGAAGVGIGLTGLSGVAATGAIGFASGFLGSGVTQLLQGGSFDICQAVTQGAIGGAAGLLGGIWGLGLAASAATDSLVAAASGANQVLLNLAVPTNLGGLNPTLHPRKPCWCP